MINQLKCGCENLFLFCTGYKVLLMAFYAFQQEIKGGGMGEQV